MADQMSGTTKIFNKDSIFGLYGAGGFGREVMPAAIDYIRKNAVSDVDISRQVFFIETHPKDKTCNGYRVLSELEFLSYETGSKFFNVAIADSVEREELSKRCLRQGAVPFSLVLDQNHPSDAVNIDEGAILTSNSLVMSNVNIGKFFHSNIFSYVAHDCVIGDYVTFAPKVACNGNVHIGDHAYIGTAAVIKPGSKEKPRVIGEGAVIGMGAVVTKDVAPYSTVVGNPAREFKPQNS